MVDAVLAASEKDLDELSFYGLWYWLGEADKVLVRIAAKEDAQAAERKEEINEAVAKFRRAMGSRTREHSADCPQLTKAEKPLAEKFLQQQLSKLQSASSDDPRMKASTEKMSKILEVVRNSPDLPVSKFVRRAEQESKQLEVEWKEVAPLYAKWEAGRHSFKTNADLQAFTRRYKDCEKGRDAAPEKLRELLCLRNDGKGDIDADRSKLAPGWARSGPQLSKAKAKAAPKGRFDGNDRRGAPPPAAKPNQWGTGVMSFAQRLRSEMAAQVRDEAEAEQAARDAAQREEEEDEDEQGEEEEEEEEAEEEDAPAQPKLLPTPKMPPPLPPSFVASGKVGVATPSSSHQPKDMDDADNEDLDNDEQIAATMGAMKKTVASATAKKKGKAGKKKVKGGRGDDDLGEVPPPKASSVPKAPPQASVWATGCEQALSGSVLQELFSSVAWGSLEEDAAEQRLDDLTQRLAWSCPLGFVLPLEWKQFAGLEVDFGPKRTSKRGTSPEMLRLQKNVPTLLGHYVTFVFFLTLLHSFSHFAVQFWVAVLQGVLLLVPRDQPQPSAPTRVLALQAVHLALWLLFVRSLWQMHVFVKIFVAMLVAWHAYAVRPIDEE